ncbi:hypothetical protein [Cupriavidus oxalaticus]|uniref:hypothetical protein n=1 Tax=Cupriavidus oxalaticus TaxID=96344 RepID=UPI00317FE493
MKKLFVAAALGLLASVSAHAEWVPLKDDPAVEINTSGLNLKGNYRNAFVQIKGDDTLKDGRRYDRMAMQQEFDCRMSSFRITHLVFYDGNRIVESVQVPVGTPFTPAMPDTHGFSTVMAVCNS